METFAAILTGLLGLGSTLGIVVDRSVTDALQKQIYSADQLEVRVDNSPNYQLLQGKIDRVRLASRGIYFVPFLRVDTLEVETDPIAIDPGSIGGGKLRLLRPLGAAVKVVLLADDINQALASPEISKSFQSIRADFSSITPELGVQELNIMNPRIAFLEGNRLRLTATLQPKDRATEQLNIVAEVSLEVIEGTQLELRTIDLRVQNVRVPELLIGPLVKGLNRLLDLRQLEQRGIFARVLKFEFQEGKVQLIGFAQLKSLP